MSWIYFALRCEKRRRISPVSKESAEMRTEQPTQMGSIGNPSAICQITNPCEDVQSRGSLVAEELQDSAGIRSWPVGREWAGEAEQICQGQCPI